MIKCDVLHQRSSQRFQIEVSCGVFIKAQLISDSVGWFIGVSLTGTGTGPLDMSDLQAHIKALHNTQEIIKALRNAERGNPYRLMEIESVEIKDSYGFSVITFNYTTHVKGV